MSHLRSVLRRPWTSPCAVPALAPALFPQLCCPDTLWHAPGFEEPAATSGESVGTDTAAGFGAVLRGFRVAAGLSQEELAERAGLSAHGISDLERGARSRPYAAAVQRLAQ